MTYADIISYLTLIQQSSHDLQATYVGDYDAIYDTISNPDQLALPAMWIESPEMVIVGNDDSSADRWSVDVIILYKGNPQNKHINQYAQELSWRTARRVLARIVHDASEQNIRATILNKVMSPIDPLSADWLIGWKISIVMDTRSVYGCYDAADWDETVAVISPLYFDAAPDGDDLVTTPVLISSSGWTYVWKYSINGGALQTLTSGVPDGAVSNTYIQVVATHTDGHVRHASLYRSAGADPATVRSVPYLYNEYNQS